MAAIPTSNANKKNPKLPGGMVGFTLIWLGQMVSVLATNMSGFALTIWVYQKTGSATALGLMQVFFITPFLLLSPIAGVMVDRYNRKLMMMLSDLTAGLATIAILLLQAAGQLQLWHLYVAMIFMGLGNTFQWPAYSAAISVMVSKEQYGRANGMMGLIEAGPGVLAPLLAGALIPLITITGILTIDVITFILAILVLLMVVVPQPPRTAEGEASRGNIWKEAAYGFRYIFTRPSLLGLQLIFFFGNLFSGISGTVLAPMILASTGNNTVQLGSVESTMAIAGVAGGIIMSIWGGFKRQVHGVLLGWFLSSLFGTFILGLGQGLPIWIAAGMISMLFNPLINASNQAIWQAKVAPDVQGRVFSARRLIAWFTNPISPLIAGTLADYVLEPAMKTQTALSNAIGGWFGTGPGSGMRLLICLCGLAAALVGISGYFITAIRNAESILPDHKPLQTPESETGAG
jgi:DHA3 family macrolide efflux protein-like MFS transporter